MLSFLWNHRNFHRLVDEPDGPMTKLDSPQIGGNFATETPTVEKGEHQHDKERLEKPQPPPLTPQQHQPTRWWRDTISTSFHHRFRTILQPTSNSISKNIGAPRVWRTFTSSSKTLEIIKSLTLSPVLTLTATSSTTKSSADSTKPTTNKPPRRPKVKKERNTSTPAMTSWLSPSFFVKRILADEEKSPPATALLSRGGTEHFLPPVREIVIPTPRLGTAQVANDDEGDESSYEELQDDKDAALPAQVPEPTQVEQIIDLDELEYSVSDVGDNENVDTRAQQLRAEESTLVIKHAKATYIPHHSSQANTSSHTRISTSKNKNKEWTHVERKEQGEGRFLVLEYAAEVATAVAAWKHEPNVSPQRQQDNADDDEEEVKQDTPTPQVVVLPPSLSTPMDRHHRRRRRRRHQLKKIKSKTTLQSSLQRKNSSSSRQMRSSISSASTNSRTSPDAGSSGGEPPEQRSALPTRRTRGHDTPSTKTSKSSSHGSTNSWKTTDEDHQNSHSKQEHHHFNASIVPATTTITSAPTTTTTPATIPTPTTITNTATTSTSTPSKTSSSKQQQLRHASIIYDLALLDHYRREIRRLKKRQNDLYRLTAVVSTVQQGKAAMQRQWEHKDELRRSHVPTNVNVVEQQQQHQQQQQQQQQQQHQHDETVMISCTRLQI